MIGARSGQGTLTSSGAGSLGMDVKQGNRWGRAYTTLGTATLAVDDSTKVRRNGKKLVSDLAVGDRVLVQARACKADLTAVGPPPALTAVRVVAHPPQSQEVLDVGRLQELVEVRDDRAHEELLEPQELCIVVRWLLTPALPDVVEHVARDDLDRAELAQRTGQGQHHAVVEEARLGRRGHAQGRPRRGGQETEQELPQLHGEQGGPHREVEGVAMPVHDDLRLVESGECVVPLSPARYLELWHRGTQESREDIGRLMRGQEPRFEFRRKEPNDGA